MARRKYNWDEWFSRDETIIVHGTHYQCSQSTMVQTIRNEASRRGIRINIVDTGTEIFIRPKYVEKTGERVSG